MFDSLFIAEELFVMDRSPDIRKKVTKQVHSSGSASDFYSGSAQLEFQPGHQLSWLRFFVIFIGSSREIQGYCPGKDHDHLLLSAFEFSHSVVISLFYTVLSELLTTLLNRQEINKSDEIKSSKQIRMCLTFNFDMSSFLMRETLYFPLETGILLCIILKDQVIHSLKHNFST